MKSEKYLNAKGEQYHFFVLVKTRPNLRDAVQEYLMYQGKTALEQMFDICKPDESRTHIHFEYPERWANILELRAMVSRIPVVFPNIEYVTITTHSVYIIQCVYREHIGVVQDAEDYPEKDYRDLSVRYCPLPNEMKGLFSFTPKGIEKVYEQRNAKK